MDQALNDAFLAYLKDRTRESFLAARAVLMGLPGWDPWSPELAEFDRLLELNDWETLEHRALEVVDNWLLTPFVHECLAITHSNQGDEGGAEFEMHLFVACAEGILTTGEGTPESPFLATRVDDSYGALLYRELEWTNERTVVRGARTFHVLAASDGRDYWFDITAASEAKQRLRLS